MCPPPNPNPPLLTSHPSPPAQVVRQNRAHYQRIVDTGEAPEHVSTTQRTHACMRVAVGVHV